MAARRSSPCKLLIIVLHANREHRRDAYASMRPTLSRPAAKIVFFLFFFILTASSGNNSPFSFGAWSLRCEVRAPQ